MDGSLIEANASNNSVVNTHSLKSYLSKGYQRLEERLDELEEHKATPANSRHISPTDPDASVTRHAGGKSKLRYKTHRAVDPQCEVITATKITPGSQDEGELLREMIDTHQNNTQEQVDTVVADSKYGTIDNYLIYHDQGVKCHIPSLEETHRGSGRQRGIFPKAAFSYNPQTDTFTCPAGHLLKRRHYHKKRNHYEYKAPSERCACCELREHCTRSKDGRSLKRHARKDELDTMLRHATSKEARGDLKIRHHLSERSFGHSTRYGYKRARWRRLRRVEIQDFLIATIQNIITLVTHYRGLLSKSNAQVGHITGAQRLQWEASPFVSSLMCFVGQFIAALTRHRGFWFLRAVWPGPFSIEYSSEACWKGL